jgi:hypothetical protein
MRRIIMLSVVLILVGLSGLSRESLGTTAQEATPTNLAEHPIVGAWLIMNANEPQTPSTAIFAADGTVTLADVPSTHDPDLGVVFLSTAIGVWEPTGERSAHVTFVQMNSDATGAYLGTLTVDGYPEVSADGQSWTDEGTQVHVTLRDASNAIVMQAGGPGEEPVTSPVHAFRMRVGNPGFPEGTPVAGTPTG